MRNQYNLKPIDANTSSGSSPDGETRAPSSSHKLQKSNGKRESNGLKSKLHSLVSGKLITTSASSNYSPQLQRLRNADALPSSSSNDHTNYALKMTTNQPQRTNYQVGSLASPANRLAQKSSAEFSARRLISQHRLPSTAIQTQPPPQAATSSEKISPELARCYDEIDQIYDYIRGLAPLPIQLRKIKSIDFELIEREKRLARQQQIDAQIHRLEQLRATSQKQATCRSADGSNKSSSTSNSPQSVHSGSRNLRSHQKPAKSRQRDASPPPVDGLEGEARRLVHEPLPIKVVTSALSHQQRPNIKRVESFNLNSLDQSTAPATTTLRSQQQQPAYLISSPQRGQLFRLPRAHSTSTLNKPNEAANVTKSTPTKKNHIGTLPAKARVPTANHSNIDELRMSGSLGRLRTRLFNLERPSVFEAQRDAAAVRMKSIDLVESYVDDDDDDEQQDCDSKSMTTTDSSAESTSGRRKRANSEGNQLHSSSSDPVTSDSSASSSSSGSESESETESECASESDDLDVKGQPEGKKSSSCGEKWTEKSHSDYENDSASLSESSSSAGKSNSKELVSRQRPADDEIRSHAVRGRDRQLEQEHIYEQIPAHKNLMSTQAQNSTSGRQPTRKQPFKYPVAYAPNIATESPRVQTSGAAKPMRHTNQTQFPLASLRPISQHYTASKRPQNATLGQFPHQQRPLDHRYRLSVGNLHLIPYLTNQQPFSSIPYQTQRLQHPPFSRRMTALEVQQQHLNRSSSSSKVNRAPRLSPAQLIAKIQVPRAINKRQQMPLISGDKQPTGSRQQQQLQMHAISKSPAQLFVWPSTIHHQQPVQTRANPFASRARGSARRLTAIGIEDISQFAQPHAHSPLKRQQVAQGHGVKHFEPPQLMKAPLIDDDDDYEEQQANSHELSSPEENAGSRRSESIEAKRKGQMASLVQHRCLNSISDLHSFSSTEDGDESASGSRTQVDELHELVDRNDDNFVSSRSFIKCYYGNEEPKLANDQKNVVQPPKSTDWSSKSLAKPTSRKLLSLIGLEKSSERSSGCKSKVTSKSATSSDPKVDPKEVRRAPRKQVKSPIVGELFVSSTAASSAQRSQPPGKLVGEFLNAEGPILVRDRRIAALRSDLIRHYQHPTVQVAKVPGSQRHHSIASSSVASSSQAAASRKQHVISNGTHTTNSTSSYEAAMKNSRSIEVPAGQPEASKVASNSPVSRKAARSSASRAPATGQPAAASSALIKVPKLSKQSHLLNRPLPRPPATSTTSPPRNQPASRQPDFASSRSQPQAAQQRQTTSSSKYRAPVKSLVSTNLDLPATPASMGQRPAAATQPHNSSPRLSERSTSGQQQQLMPLRLVTQPSPTVTTYTSSGISSRLTSGTHLASNASSGGSSGRSRSVVKRRMTTTSDSTSFKCLPTNTRGQISGAPSNPLGFDQSDDFELMDEQVNGECEDDDDNRAAQLLSSSGNRSNKDRRGTEEQQAAMSSNLKLFDERFSSKFIDKHLASSDDSLLESINFSGTLNRAKTTSSRKASQ